MTSLGAFQTASAIAPLPGFTVSPYYAEQVLTFIHDPDVRIHINAPALHEFDLGKPTGVALYCLPNGNTIEQTIGKMLKPGDDWHYDIQHIGAQTRFLRRHIREYNLVISYLETTQMSWPAWKRCYSDHPAIIKKIVDSINTYFAAYHPFFILTGHSGGGSFTFGYLDAVDRIPDDIRRIFFLDSNYGYENRHGPKFVEWLKASPDHFLSVIAYDDSVALYRGKPVVSDTGGTWHRSKMMVRYLAEYFPFETEIDLQFIRHSALNGRIQFILKHNPNRAILHTIQVERNGFIQGMLCGTIREGIDYRYYGERAYEKWIQPANPLPKLLSIPPRPPDTATGSEFIDRVTTLSFEQREAEIQTEITQGNIPDFLRRLVTLKSMFQDAAGRNHEVIYQVMPDYLAIGSDSDFCRIPMGPVTAQKIADQFGATLPTTKLVDDIFRQSVLKLTPVSYLPVGNRNELVAQFILHHQDIEEQRLACGKPPGELVSGIKKDVVISSLIADTTRRHHVVIYGWHRPDGTAIQPLTNIHINSYVDYSHGIRLINAEMLVDGTLVSISEILQHPTYFKMLSDEAEPMKVVSYEP